MCIRDRTRAIAGEIIRGGADRVLLALDFFDASINRISAWAVSYTHLDVYKRQFQRFLHFLHIQGF